MFCQSLQNNGGRNGHAEAFVGPALPVSRGVEGVASILHGGSRVESSGGGCRVTCWFSDAMTVSGQGVKTSIAKINYFSGRRRITASLFKDVDLLGVG